MKAKTIICLMVISMYSCQDKQTQVTSSVGEMAGEMAGEMMFEPTVEFITPGAHMATIPPEVDSLEVVMWGAGGSGGAQLGSTGGGAAAGRFQLDLTQFSHELILWVGEGAGRQGSGGGGSFLYYLNENGETILIAAIAGGGGGASDGNSGRSWTGGRGGAGGWTQGQSGQDLGVHQNGTMYEHCRAATPGTGATQVGPGNGGAFLGTANGCIGISGQDHLGGSVTSSGIGDQFRCVENMEREAWTLALGQGNGGGGAGGGGYYGGGSGGFVWTYCGAGGGGGSSWVHPNANNVSGEDGQNTDPGFLLLSNGAGFGGQEDHIDLPRDDTSYQGQHGRIAFSY